MHCCCGRLEPTFVKAYSRLAKGLVEPQSVLQAEAALEASLLLLSFLWFQCGSTMFYSKHGFLQERSCALLLEGVPQGFASLPLPTACQTCCMQALEAYEAGLKLEKDNEECQRGREQARTPGLAQARA